MRYAAEVRPYWRIFARLLRARTSVIGPGCPPVFDRNRARVTHCWRGVFELDDTLTEVGHPIEIAVSGDDVDVAVGAGGRSATGMPDAAAASMGGRSPCRGNPE